MLVSDPGSGGEDTTMGTAVGREENKWEYG